MFTASKKEICTKGWASAHRFVPYALKRKVYAEYGMKYNPGHKYVIDHLVPLELGGANEIGNLWPEPKQASYSKDTDENDLHSRVCFGNMKLAVAQWFFVKYYSVK